MPSPQKSPYLAYLTFDLSLSHQKAQAHHFLPVFFLPQGTVLAKQVGAVSYVECSSRSSERSVRDVFHVATVASLGRGHRQLRRTDSRRGLQRSAQLSGRPDRGPGTEGEIHKDRAKSCNLM